MDRKWDDKELKSVDIAAAGAEEYAVYGWAQWAHTDQKSTWHNIFRISDY
jgi:hypothetical protein